MTPRVFAIPLLAVLLAACQPGDTPRPVPSVQQLGADLKCEKGDHGYADSAGWGFCYPGAWRYQIRAQPSTDLRGFQELDITFDITDTQTGLFAFMIISTYERKGSPDLASWAQDDLKPPPNGSAIVWGNAVEAVRLDDGRRLALTPTQVVVLDLRSGSGNLDLEGAMSTRLGTWKFYF